MGNLHISGIYTLQVPEERWEKQIMFPAPAEDLLWDLLIQFFKKIIL